MLSFQMSYRCIILTLRPLITSFLGCLLYIPSYKKTVKETADVDFCTVFQIDICATSACIDRGLDEGLKDKQIYFSL